MYKRVAFILLGLGNGSAHSQILENTKICAQNMRMQWHSLAEQELAKMGMRYLAKKPEWSSSS